MMFSTLVFSILILLMTPVAQAQTPVTPPPAPVAPTPTPQPSTPVMRGDVSALNYTSFDDRGDSSVDFNTATPPIYLGNVIWVNTIGERRSTLHPRGIFNGRKMEMADFAYSAIFVKDFEDNYRGMTRVILNSRSATKHLDTDSEALFLSGVVMVSHAINGKKNYRWSAGFILPGRAQPIPIIPGLGLEYDSAENDFQIRLGIPLSTIAFYPSPRWRLGAFFSFDSVAYRLAEDSELRVGDIQFLRQERFMTGAAVRYSISKYIGVNLRVGATLSSRTALENGDFKKRVKSAEPTAPYYLIGLAIGL